jgi:hypothetical protein
MIITPLPRPWYLGRPRSCWTRRNPSRTYSLTSSAPWIAIAPAGAGATGLWGELLAAPVRKWRDVLEDAKHIRADRREVVRRGGFPVPAHERSGPEERALWYTGYLQTYLERDLPELRAVENLVVAAPWWRVL